jgi:hypothetical protein
LKFKVPFYKIRQSHASPGRLRMFFLVGVLYTRLRTPLSSSVAVGRKNAYANILYRSEIASPKLVGSPKKV